MKTCSKCKIEKLESEFSICNKKTKALHRWCKPCHAEYNRVRNHKLGIYKRFRDDPPDDLMGREFGYLSVQSCIGSKRKVAYGTRCAWYWMCKCECGREKELSTESLLSGKYITCGKCGIGKIGNRSHNWKGYEEISAGEFCNIKNSAKLRGLDFDISVQYIWNIFLKQDRKCALTGIDINFSHLNGIYKKIEKTASLDRIDSSKGYIRGNVQWVHKTINKMKNSLSDEEFISWCNFVITNKNKKEAINVEK